MAQSSIEWTNAVWNPTTGCTKISQGCKNCYAEKMHKRLAGMGQAKYSEPFTKVVCHESELERDFGKKPKMIFVNSMSDLFHKDVPSSFIKRVFQVMNDNPQHTFQVLTKRPDRMLELSPMLGWSDNIWAGTSIESTKVVYRADFLRNVPASVRFLSCEPLIDELMGLYLMGIHWVIVGGESGNDARPIRAFWIEEIHMQCIKMNIPFFFKQWGGANKKKSGRLWQGKEWNEMPRLYQNT